MADQWNLPASKPIKHIQKARSTARLGMMIMSRTLARDDPASLDEWMRPLTD
jgi:hypothetical protein